MAELQPNLQVASSSDVSDPYAGTGFEQGAGRISTRDTNAGARDGAYARQNIINSFLGFGYYPTEAEVASLISTSEGEGGSEAGASAVANYVNYQKAEVERQKNDPLKAFQEMATKTSQDYANRSQNLYKQAQDLFTQAPKLFGSFTPDQIKEYLAPLQTAFQQAQAVTEGANARRGTVGSSIEANALQAGNTQFQENVLSQGLQIGIDQQAREAEALLKQGGQLQSSSDILTGHGGEAARQRSAQGLGQTNLLASLPNFLSQEALQNQVTRAQLNSGPSLWDQIDRGISTTGNILSLGARALGQGQTTPGGYPAQSGGAPMPQGSPTMNGGSAALNSYPAYANNPYLNTEALVL